VENWSDVCGFDLSGADIRLSRKAVCVELHTGGVSSCESVALGGRDREPGVSESSLLVVSGAALVRASRTVTQRSSPASCRRRTRVMK